MKTVNKLALAFSMLVLFTVTTLAQTVSSISPLLNARDVSLTNNITINFSESMDNATITTSTVIISGSQRGLYSGSFSYGSNSATFDPDSSFFPGEIITVVVTDGVENASNTPLSAPYRTMFTAEASGSAKFQALEEYTADGSNFADWTTTADVNEDGYIDIITLVPSQNKMSVFINDGDGTYTGPTNYTTANSFQVEAKDVDQDGSIDLVTSNNNAYMMSVFINNGSGSGTFASKVDYANGSSWNGKGLTTGDIDNDGDEDVLIDVIIGGSVDSIQVFTNDGDGTFTIGGGISTTDQFEQLKMADIDGDEDLDLIGISPGLEQLWSWTNDGSGNFSANTSSSVAASALSFTLANFNGNGPIDAVTTGQADDQYTVVTEDGTFLNAFWGTPTDVAAGDGPTGIASGDLDGDGDIDVVISNAYDQDLSILINNGSASFTESNYSTSGNYANYISLADVDNDGDLDIITSNNDGTVSVIRNYPGGSVASISPAHGATDISASANIAIKFDEGMNSSTLTASTVQVFGSLSGLHGGSYNYTSGDSTLTIDPTDDFLTGELVTVIVSTGAENTVGTPMEFGSSTNFVVAAGEGEIFGTAANYTAGNETNAVVAADVDGDGESDLVVVNTSADSIAVLIGAGDGSFASPVNYYAGDAPSDVAAGDLDGDGDLDLIVSTTTDNVLSRFLNNGDGTFAARTTYASSSSPASISLGDIDNDGDLDVFYSASTVMYTQLNNGSGVFSSESVWGTNSTVVAPPVDLNGDGLVDYVGVNGNSLNFVLNDGDGTYTYGSSSLSGFGSVAGGVVTGDFDGDGDIDIVSSYKVNSLDGYIAFSENDGTGSMAGAVSYTLTSNGNDNPGGLTALDIDGDGDLDIAVVNTDFDQVVVFLNDGNGVFTSDATYTTGDSPEQVSSADMNGDGIMDLAVANSVDDNVSVLLGGKALAISSVSPDENDIDISVSSDITITFNQSVQSGTVTTSTVIAVGSVSGAIAGAVTYDGGSNTATLNPTDNFIAGEMVTVFVTTGVSNAAGSSLSSAYQYSFTVEATSGEVFLSPTDIDITSSISDLKFVDFDNDGDADVVTSEGGGLGVYLNDGSGGYTFSDTTSSTNTQTKKIAIADFDQDGYADAVATINSQAGYFIQVFINDQAGSFDVPVGYSYSTNYAAGIYAADINLDGYPDIVATRYNADAIHVLLNDGDGTFTAQSAVTVGGGPYLTVQLIDVDSDNDLDLVTSDWDDNTISVAKNNGDGTFASHSSYNMTGSGVYTGVFASGDIDGDGDLDLVASQTDGDDEPVSGVTVFFNNGSGDYSTTSSITATAGDVELMDMDGDGDLDLVTSNEGVVSVYHNNGSGSFTASAYTASVSSWIYGIDASDIDGDGDIDLAAGSSGDLHIFQNGELVAVSSTTPSKNGLDFTASSDITVTFNTNMNVSTFQDTSVIVTGSKSGVISSVLSLSNPTLTINPDNNFLPGEIVTVTLTNDLESSSGTALYKPYGFSFTVAASGNGNLTYSDTTTISNYISRILSLDVDGDGDEDILANGNSNIEVFKNSSGTYTSFSETSFSSIEYLYPADLDNDGDIDGIIKKSGSNSITVIENDGSGNFTLRDTTTISSSSLRAFEIADFNGDGFSDFSILVGSQTFYIRFGNGDFTFSSSSATPDFTFNRLTSGDIDNDGDVDLIGFSGSDSKMQVMLNSGTGSFTKSTTYSSITSTSSSFSFHPKMGDFDGDGYLDIVIPHGSGYEIILNDGDGTFGSPVSYGTGAFEIDQVTPFDYDGDGDLDLGMFTDDDNDPEEFLFAYNDGNGGFANQLFFNFPQTESLYLYGVGEGRYAFTDYDGDDDLDLVAGVTGYSGGTVYALAVAENDPPAVSTAPDTAASSVSFSSISAYSAKISWTNGNGARRMVFVKEGSAVDTTPSDDAGYSPNPAFGSGSEIGTGNFAVYGGASNSIVISGLDSETEYHVQVFELNGIPGSEKFYTTGAPTGSFTTAAPPTVWSKDDATVTFTKTDYADPTLEANQDRITDYVWFTRANSRGLFNAFDESFYDNDDYSSPSGTQWAVGTTDDISSLSFDTFYNTLNGNIGDNIVGQDMVVYVEGEDLYFDINFSSWTDGGNGGGFSYTRSDGDAPTPLTQSFQTTPGYAVRFDDGNNYEQYFEITTSNGEYPVFGHRFTTEMWVKPDTSGLDQVFFELYGPEIVMGINSSDQFYAYHTQSSSGGSTITITDAATMTKDQWYHVALTGESGDSLRLYVNGIEVAADAITDVSEDEDYGNYWYLGSDYDNNYPYYGAVDELRIWKTVRTESEIRSYMHRPYSGIISPLAAYWQFTEGSGDAYDGLNNFQADAYDDVSATWFTSDVPLGEGTVEELANFQSGTQSIGNASITTTDDFDNPVDVQVTEVTSDPNKFPTGFTAGLGNKYFVINLFGTPGTFNVSLTLTFGSGVITSTQASNPGTLKLYRRASNSTGDWTEIASATSANSTTGVVTWSGITSFSQFMAVNDTTVNLIGIDDDTDVTVYDDSTYTFSSTFFDPETGYEDSTLTISVSSTPGGTLFIDKNDNETYDSGTDDLLEAGQEFSYTPGGSDILSYTNTTQGIDTVVVTLASASYTDSVSINMVVVEGAPSISGVADENSWHLMSNPFSTDLGTLFADIWTQGAVNSNAPAGNATLYTFSQDSSVYVPITTDLDTTSLSAGTGVLAYIFAFDDYAEGVPEGGGWPKNITNYGNPFGSDLTISVKNVDSDETSGTSGYEGFALFGNPFGWSLSADSLIATLKRGDAAANNYVYRWDVTNSEWDQVTSGEIYPYESVFLRVETSETTVGMNLNYSDRYQAASKQLKDNKFEMMLTHRGTGITSGSQVRFDEKAKEGIDPYDAYYLGSYANEYANLYTLIGDQTLTINNVPTKSGKELEYPVYLDATVNGNFELQWNSELLPETGSYILEDIATGTRIDLRAQNKYSFNVGAKTKLNVDEKSETTTENGKADEDLDLKEEISDKATAKDLAINGDTKSQSIQKEATRTTGMLLPTQAQSKSKSASTKIDEQLFKLIINTGMVSDIEEDLGLPETVELYQNYPNPFNPTSIIRYGVPEMSEVTLEVFDMLGRKVATLIDGETKHAGRYNVQFNARSLASGMYIYRLKIGSKILTKKMTLIK